jgi:hypothetical protein
LEASGSDRAPDPGGAILRLGAADRSLLDVVGRHPFMSIDQLAVALGRDVASLRAAVRAAIGSGLLRVLGSDEIGPGAGGLRLLELTESGLRVVAAQQGLALPAAVRLNGLVGGGPVCPIGPRRKLVAQLAHTQGTDGVFVRLIAQARASASRGSDAALLEWRNAAACARGPVRPDGYGLYRQDGRLYGFFLEYDRGTMSSHGYCAKLVAYADYLANGRYTRDYVGYPTILVVATDNAAEERLAGAAHRVDVGRMMALPVLLTSAWRIDHPLNAPGLLGAIWREPGRDFSDRRPWLRPSEAR